MTSQALYRKWRSRTFDELVGQEHVTQTLANALRLNRVTHAYLFTGPRGTGKTSMARLLAKAVNCLAPDPAERPCNQCSICVAVNEGRLLDLIEIDAASNTGVDDIRDLRDKVNFRPGEARIKFYIIDEVHMLSNSAFNALLKTLEEPPSHVIFVLATTEPEKIPATITSRCQRFDFKRIRLGEVVQRLARIAAEEGFQVEPEALEYVARQGGGSMRDAISLLDQLTAYGQETITLDLVHSVLGVVASHSVIELAEALINQDVAHGLDVINQVVSDGADPRQFAREIVEYLRAVMLAKLGEGVDLLNLPDEILAQVAAQATRVDRATIVRATTLFNAALLDIKSGLLAVPQLPLELAFIQAAVGRDTEGTAPAREAGPTQAGWSGVPAAEVRFPVSPPPAQKAPPQPPVTTPPLPPAAAGLESPAPLAAVAGEGQLTMEMVKRGLPRVLQDIEPKNKTMAETLRNHVQLYRVAGQEIHFVTSDFNKGRFEKPRPKAAIDDAFSRILGQAVVVRFFSEKNISLGGPAPLEFQGIGQESGNSEEDLQALLKVAKDLGGEVSG